MSWHFSQRLVEDFENSRSSLAPGAESLAGSCSAGEPSAPSRSMTTAGVSSCSGSATEFLSPSPSGMTCELSTADLGGGLLMWFRAGFRAKEFQRLAIDQDLSMSRVAYGENRPASLARYCRDSCSWKTRQSCLLTGEFESLETLPKWGTVANGELWVRDTPALTMKGTGYGFLPTPRCSRGFTNPTLGKPRSDCLTTALLGKPVLGMRPKIEFVEWMMGFPIGWTDLRPLEMRKFQRWLDSHGRL